MNSAAVIAAHALDVRLKDIPDEVMTAAKTFILDSLGVGVAGAAAKHADDVLHAARGWGAADGQGDGHVFGKGLALPAPSAAFVNGFQIHCQEYDCVHEPAVVHPMATICAALTAEVERAGAAGSVIRGVDYISAVVVAVDVAAGLGVAAKLGIRFFRPATAGIFGAALGIARMRKFNHEATLNALGYALAFTSGTMQAHVEGKPALPVQIGNAARGAMMACDLAAAGMPGPVDVFDGSFGYLSLFEGESDLAPVIASFGQTWRIAEVSHKPFPTGRAAQGGIVAVQRLREKGVTADNLDRLTLMAPPLIKRLVGRPYKLDMAVNYARLCFGFSGAVALIDGGVGLSDFSEERLRDHKVGEIAQRIEVVDDGTADPAAFTPQVARAVLKDGQTIEVTIDALYGSPQNPLSRDAHLEKFRRCLAFGFDGEADTIVSARADELIERVDNLDRENDAAVLARLASGL